MTKPRSVLLGRDPAVLDILLPMHARPEPRILDVTYGEGVMWKGLAYKPVRMDIDTTKDVDEVGSFLDIPFPDASFDVVVFDPPHLPNAGSTEKSLSGNAAPYRQAYGLGVTDTLRSGDHVGQLFAPFLLEARRVLSADGIVLAKIADLVHNHLYQWQHVDYIQAVRCAGLTPCDVMIKSDPSAGRLQSGRWQNVHHLRRAHTYWIVARKGRCEPAW